MSYKHPAIPLAAILAFFLPLHAQAEGVSVGFGFGTIELDDNLGGERDTRLDGRIGYSLTDAIEIEGQVIRATNILDETLTAYMFNAVLNLNPDRPLGPYFLLGIGSATVDIPALFGSSVDDGGFAFQMAVGNRVYLGRSRRFGVRLELSLLGEETFNGSSHHVSLVTGLTWRFGN